VKLACSHHRMAIYNKLALEAQVLLLYVKRLFFSKGISKNSN